MKKAFGSLLVILCVLLACTITAASAQEVTETVATPAPAGDSTGTLRVLVFEDRNGNGLKAANEYGVSGVTVNLLNGEETVASLTTGSSGEALFDNVPAGTYRTQAILPGGLTFSDFGGEGDKGANAYQFSIEGSQTSGELAVAAGEETQQGIGVQTAYHVSGFCWEDTTLDGVYKKDEPKMAGIRITLDGQKNGLHYETVSGEDGSWYIDRVCPAFYTLTVYVPDGMMFTRQPTVSGIRSIFLNDAGKGAKTLDLNDKKSKEDQNVGFAVSAIVKGICYLDANYNGFYDEGEEPLPGVKMTAIRKWDNAELAVTFSGEDGRFSLSGLRGNTYTIRAVLPDDGSTFTVTRDEPLGNHYQSREGRRENFWTDFVLENFEVREIAVGAIYTSTVKGTVYLDDDFSATMNGKEKIVSNYLVTLKDSDGNVVAEDKTSIRGVYELTDVPPGTFSLSVQALKGYAFTKKGEGNVILNKTGGEGYSEPFVVGMGETITGKDIGMIRPGTVEGDVFADRNDNGLRDAGEKGMAGVTVRLMDEEGEAFSAEIGEDGHFLFDAVMPGRYWVEYTLPEGAVFSRTASGGSAVTGENGTGKTEAFNFVTGDYRQAPLCGALTLGSIDGTAYRDHNGNGIQDADEDVLAGMAVTLTPSREDLEPVTVTTGADGAFLLADLRPDTYTLEVACPEGYVMSRTDYLELPLTAGKTEQAAELPLAMGDSWSGQMVGAAMPAAIRGRIWLDENNNGLFDEGEQTPAGMAVTITDEYTGKVFDTPVTNGEGYYSAAGMIPGSFTVSFQLDDITLAPKPGDNQFVTTGDRLELTGITLRENEVYEGLLLGIVRYTRISGSVWIDRGDAFEALPGAVITLMDGEGSTVASTVSGEDGTYAFRKLMPGVYTLEAEMPEGCVIIEPGDRRLADGMVSVMTFTRNRTGSSDPIELQMDHHRDGLDIGCVLPGSIGDVCWLDLDRDGLQGAGEGGIPGVRIEALRDGVAVAETVTDQYGFYRLPDLYPAEYVLRVTAPEEVKPTVRRTDIPMIASVLEESDSSVCYTAEIAVESNKANYNNDLGFMLRRDGVLPAGYGEGKTQNWQ